MADGVDLRVASTRKVVNWYVRHRAGQLDKPLDARLTRNGHVHPVDAVRHRYVANSIDGSEDEVDGPISYSNEPVIQRRINGSLSADPAVTNGHVNSDVPDGVSSELPHELVHIITTVTNEFEQRYERVSLLLSESSDR
jgi:hypothetical protein